MARLTLGRDLESQNESIGKRLSVVPLREKKVIFYCTVDKKVFRNRAMNCTWLYLMKIIPFQKLFFS